ncbi:hypothetical protein CONPUDRAFT_162559 [Coniophora puteana RWD-64-598 SS2]|uniref:Uncharacterized protein n=1 Tax=Coniophora puteana (strain RWD-64-598) TaxID=741705 RepID=A0A5M3N1T4_CONPW|nr:uncharacterized protein CONPUDRAFT_162559 [Coniophora puteana RWD-64-598 SS2]EIW85350.1 hypothetical protein CONPUDRAFT_162559 [Coniophora puteana RWD-64-598 SS2]
MNPFNNDTAASMENSRQSQLPPPSVVFAFSAPSPALFERLLHQSSPGVGPFRPPPRLLQPHPPLALAPLPFAPLPLLPPPFSAFVGREANVTRRPSVSCAPGTRGLEPITNGLITLKGFSSSGPALVDRSCQWINETGRQQLEPGGSRRFAHITFWVSSDIPARV